ncbi:hypothetical protein LTR62_006256 [Meristemomyces frigidus]|uniref:SUZ domain-containing protein n=1 Tax=Meristemomyces frigidus TaxID=1508187 RepID=A0AAN7YIP0_9PEZI|nr:hypothetical protein LTR62_006256 [Meristemomyces frigidus]
MASSSSSSSSSSPAQPSAPKLSFAKIVATGLKPASRQAGLASKTNGIPKGAITSAPRDGNAQSPAIANPGTFTAAQPTEALRSPPSSSRDATITENRGHTAQVCAPRISTLEAVASTTGLLTPVMPEEPTTQLSFSSYSAKPPSLDEKSVTSGTTFALDEKESLRPDDSASLKAVDDEDSLVPSVLSVPKQEPFVDDGLSAFDDQLREITRMEPTLHSAVPSFSRPPAQPAMGVLYVPPLDHGVSTVSRANAPFPNAPGMPDSPPDPRLLEALDSPRDRLMVMKLQTDITDFMNDVRETSLILPQTNAYHRMLAHKAADYYMLGHVGDDIACGIRLFKTPSTRLRPPLIDITTPSTAASTPPPNAPQMRILRRGGEHGPAIVNGSNMPSKTTSESGEDEEKKRAITREEREARYEAARLRIMGSAKPQDQPEDQKPSDVSRSSSAAGKKQKKKQRSDSEDGFEARSAYSHYYAPAYATTSYTPSPHPYTTAAPLSTAANFPLPAIASQMTSGGGYQAYTQPMYNMQWPVSTAAYDGAAYPSYDLAADYQRAMSLQNPPMSSNAAFSPLYNSGSSQQQSFGAVSPWTPTGYQQAPGTPSPGYSNGYGQATQSQAQDAQPYLYGQLPSQTFPGRQPSRLEHPLPGSYKGKHFDPQSQSFVPTQPTGPGAHMGASGTATSSSGLSSRQSSNSHLHRVTSTQSQSSVFGNLHQQQGSHFQGSPQPQPMLHPLPQPVFPQQPSPNLPLPPKPTSTSHAYGTYQQQPMASYSDAPNEIGASSIAKWGAPSSLPAKPPPGVEAFDSSKYTQSQQRNLPFNTTAPRMSSGSMPSYGNVPPYAAGGGSGM